MMWLNPLRRFGNFTDVNPRKGWLIIGVIALMVINVLLITVLIILHRRNPALVAGNGRIILLTTMIFTTLIGFKIPPIVQRLSRQLTTIAESKKSFLAIGVFTFTAGFILLMWATWVHAG